MSQISSGQLRTKGLIVLLILAFSNVLSNFYLFIILRFIHIWIYYLWLFLIYWGNFVTTDAVPVQKKTEIRICLQLIKVENYKINLLVVKEINSSLKLGIHFTFHHIIMIIDFVQSESCTLAPHVLLTTHTTKILFLWF